MTTHFKRLTALLTALLLVLSASFASARTQPPTLYVNASDYPVAETGVYTTMEEVAVYLNTYDHLPDNFITKAQARAFGWDSGAGNLWLVAPGKSIGGDNFGNYEGLLPSAKGRKWTECDIAFDGGYRNGLRLIFSSDGLLFYTADHYASFNKVVVRQSVIKDGQENGSKAWNTVSPR